MSFGEHAQTGRQLFLVSPSGTTRKVRHFALVACFRVWGYCIILKFKSLVSHTFYLLAKTSGEITFKNSRRYLIIKNVDIRLNNNMST